MLLFQTYVGTQYWNLLKSICQIVYIKATFSVCYMIFMSFSYKSHNMKALVILSHSWSLFSHLLVYKEQINFSGSLYGLLEYFPEKKNSSQIIHDHDHHWADLVMAWLP